MDKAAFRSEFPEFASTVKYPDAQLDFWASIAEKQTVQTIWLDLYPFAVKLYVAHEIVLAYQNAQASSSGGVPGQSGGISSSKSVGSVSVSYDQNLTAEKNAGWWNLTRYGQQYIRLARMFGAQAIQL